MEDFDNEFQLSLTINGARAAAGASQVINALRAVQEAGVRTQQNTTREAEKAARDQERLAKQAAREQVRAAKDAERERVKSERATAQAARETAREQVKAAKDAAREQIAAEREVERFLKQAHQENLRRFREEGIARNQAMRRVYQDTKASQRGDAAGSSGLGTMALGLATGATAHSIVRTIASYEGLKSSLITATKSASGAEAAFKDLQSFADKTPYTLEQATKAYIRMSSAGLKPSIAALTDFGDIASAIPGKDILDFVEAVADGTQGQGRRLKEFGIDLGIEGDKAKLRFGDMTLTVQNDAKSIEDALRKIAQAQFGGSMERQSKTLAGQWSTLQDKAAGLAMAVGEGGLLDAMKEVVVSLTEATSGGQSTAKALGEALGDAVRGTAAAARFLASHLSEVKAMFGALLAYKAASWISTVATSFKTATVAAGGFRAAMTAAAASNPFAWIAVGIGLLIELRERWDDIVNLPGKAAGVVQGYAGNVMNAIDKIGKPPSPYDYVDVAGPDSLWALPSKRSKESGEVTFDFSGSFLDPNKRKSKAASSAGGESPKKKELSEAAKAANEFAEALADLATEAKHADETLGLMMGGASQREKDIAAKMQGFAGKGYGPEELAQLRAKVEAIVDAESALQELQDAEQAYQEGKDKAAKDAADAQEKAQKAAADAFEKAQKDQEKAEEEALKRRKQRQEDWVDFAIDGIEKFGDALTAVFNKEEHAVRDLLIQMGVAAANLALTQATSPGGALTGASIFHSGGVVGAGGSYRSVSPSVFIGASRMHAGGYAGLRPDEVPAILQRGERVLSRREVSQGGIGGRSNRNYSIGLNLYGIKDSAGFRRNVPLLLRRLRNLNTFGGRDDD